MTFAEKLKAFFTQEGVQIPGEKSPVTSHQPPVVKTFTEDEVKVRETAAAAKAKEDLDRQHAVERHRAEVKTFVEGLKAKGQFLPAWEKMGLLQVIEALPAEATITFGEGKPQQSPYQVIRTFLESLPKLVTLEEIAKGKGPAEIETAQEAGALFTSHELVFRQLGVTREQLTKAMSAKRSS